MFENLNQIVDFYSTRELVRGICLKFPVNEKTIGQYSASDLSASSPGCYMELKDLDKVRMDVNWLRDCEMIGVVGEEEYLDELFLGDR